MSRFKRLRPWLRPALAGMAAGLLGLAALHSAAEYTSTNSYCASCHVHPRATDTWKQGPHFQTDSGMQVSCVECHLPPGGLDHYLEKASAGLRDLYGYYFKDHAQFDWEAKSVIEQAVHYTFDSACSRCHRELFPFELSNKGVDAHLHYRKTEGLACVNCHLGTGHHQEKPLPEAAPPEALADQDEQAPPLADALKPGELADYTEVIPSSGLRFTMVAVPGGSFLMGSPPDEEGRSPHEGPQRQIEISPFWMGKFEVSWEEYEAFYAATATRGKNEQGSKSDALTGPTPPYGSPDQGWGRGRHPAITMTHYAAAKYCQWLSAVTGRSYRLPSEAEWEYACRAGTTGRYPFLQDESEDQGWLGWFGGADQQAEELLSRHAWYRANSRLRTHSALDALQPNPWGLHNMMGNVKEFCLDFYQPDILASYPEGPIRDPRGPGRGAEHVIRGGSFKSGASELRSAWRAGTRQQQWLKTDPQTPKSVWWYSDNNEVGFRVVREFRPAASLDQGGQNGGSSGQERQ